MWIFPTHILVEAVACVLHMLYVQYGFIALMVDAVCLLCAMRFFTNCCPSHPLIARSQYMNALRVGITVSALSLLIDGIYCLYSGFATLLVLFVFVSVITLAVRIPAYLAVRNMTLSQLERLFASRLGLDIELGMETRGTSGNGQHQPASTSTPATHTEHEPAYSTRTPHHGSDSFDTDRYESQLHKQASAASIVLATKPALQRQSSGPIWRIDTHPVQPSNSLSHSSSSSSFSSSTIHPSSPSSTSPSSSSSPPHPASVYINPNTTHHTYPASPSSAPPSFDSTDYAAAPIGYDDLTEHSISLYPTHPPR